MTRSLILTTCLMAIMGLLLTGCGKPAEQSPPAPSAEPAPAVGEPEPAPTEPEPAPAAPSATATLYRDTWGVPHVYADTMPDAAYAIGYAQAEDRLDDIYTNIRTAIGAMAEAFGPEFVEQDYYMRLIKNDTLCAEYWETAPEEMRAIGDRFMDGVNAYLAEHPDKKPDHALDLQGWHCLSVGRAMIMKWPLGNMMDDLSNKHKAPGFGSNGWAVAPSRSAEGCPILLTDPHLSWEGLAVFHEARVHAGDLGMNGYFLVGSPLAVLGNNGHVGWACTTGGPDTADVYMLKLNPENPLQYEYDGEWKTATATAFTINVKDADPVVRPAVYTHLGPFIEEPDKETGTVCVGATPYMDQTGLVEQMYLMMQAKNCDEFYEALSMNQFMEQNLMFADTSGNIQYVRLGCAPVRPEGYDWNAPVPGNTSATKWLGIHDLADLVQIKNPPQGYFQNCNISPELMMLDSPMTPDKYVPYLFNVTWDYTNPRGRRSTKVLSEDESMTKEEAMALAMDVYDPLGAIWRTAFGAAIRAAGAEYMKDIDFAQAAQDFLAWNGEFTSDSKGTVAFEIWRLKFPGVIPVEDVVNGGELSKENQTKLLDLFAQTVAEMKEKYGSIDVTWGDVHKVGRGGVLYPCGGADFGANSHGPNFTETLFDVRSSESPKGSGTYVGNNGSMAMMLMFLHPDGIEAYTCTPWGQNADPASPHYMDQGEKLFSQRQFKPTWFTKDELLQHVESEKVLTIQ